jgi:hypothetical protein
VERNPDRGIGPATEMLTGDTETAMGTAGVQENRRSEASIDINQRIMGARGTSELWTRSRRVQLNSITRRPSASSCRTGAMACPGLWSEHCRRSKRRPCGGWMHAKNIGRQHPSYHGQNSLPPWDRTLVPKIEGRAEALAGTFKAQGVANMLWAYATMGRAARGGTDAGAGGAGGGAGGHLQGAKRGKHAVGVCDDEAGARGGTDEGAGGTGGGAGGHRQRAGCDKPAVVGARVFRSVRPWARKAMGAVSVAVSVAYGAASHAPGQGSVLQQWRRLMTCGL